MSSLLYSKVIKDALILVSEKFKSVTDFCTSFCHVEVYVSVAFSVCVYIQVPSLCEDLLSSVDQPLKIARDKVVGKDYLLCDYNRDGDSYRSSL